MLDSVTKTENGKLLALQNTVTEYNILHYAAESRSPEVFEALLQSLDKRDLDRLVLSKDIGGNNLFHFLAVGDQLIQDPHKADSIQKGNPKLKTYGRAKIEIILKFVDKAIV